MLPNQKINDDDSSNPTVDLVSLPDEIKFEIAKHLDNIAQVKNLGKTCWTFFKFTKDPALKRFFHYDYSKVNENVVLNDNLQDISAIAVSSDDQVIAVTTRNPCDNLHLLNANTGEIITTLSGRFNQFYTDNELYFTKNNKYLIVLYYAQPDDGGCSWESRINAHPGIADIDIWGVANGEKIHTYRNMTKALKRLPFPNIQVISNNEFIVTYKGNQYPYYLNNADSRAYRCDILTKTFSEYNYDNKCDSKHISSYLSPNEKWLISISKIPHSLFSLYDFKTGEKLSGFNIPEPSSHLKFIDDDTFAYIHRPRYTFINKFRSTNQPVSNANQIQIITYNLTNKTFNSISIEEILLEDHNFERIIDFTKLTKNCLAIMNNKQNKISIWDLKLKKCINTIDIGHTQSIISTSDGNSIISVNHGKLHKISFPNLNNELIRNNDNDNVTQLIKPGLFN